MKRFLFIFIYRLFFLPLAIVILPYYALKMWRRGGYRRYFWHRFGWVPKVKRLPVWIQAVSVGEVEALQPLLEIFKKENIPVYLTTTTSTGFRIAERKYRFYVDVLAYFPLDFWVFMKIAWWRIHPKLIFLMESELWPEHMHQAALHKVPVYLINGRCSNRSFSYYQLWSPIPHTLLSWITKVFAASACDAQRFRQLCPKTIPVVEVGNLKMDAALNSVYSSTAFVSRSELCDDAIEGTVFLLGASTWPGEEKLLLKIFLKARRLFANVRLILAPRHTDRIREIEVLLQAYQVTFCFRTKPEKNVDVYVVNTTGELQQFVRLADLIFIGKSLPPNKGGQTPIDAAAYGKPMLYGPHMENFSDICKKLEEVQGAYKCADATIVEKQLLYWLQYPEDAARYGRAAQQWLQDNRGVAQRILKELAVEGLPSH